MRQGNKRWILYLVGLLFLTWAAAGCQVLPDKGMSCPADQVVCQGFNGPPRMRSGAYPADWDNLPESRRSEIAKEIALAAAPYLTYTMTSWHEILTWYGFKVMVIPTEFPSAFSWEDSFSNLLGTVVAVHALQDSEHSYEEAVKIALDEEMVKLGVQPAAVCKRASESMRGAWYTGNITAFVTMKKRNFDIGLDNGMVTPTLVPNVPECPGAEPLPYPAPKLDVLAKYGFSLKLEIEPHEWESGKILRIAYAGEKPKKRITPEQHFPILMKNMRQAATVLYPEFDYTAYEDGGSPRTDRATQ